MGRAAAAAWDIAQKIHFTTDALHFAGSRSTKIKLNMMIIILYNSRCLVPLVLQIRQQMHLAIHVFNYIFNI